MAISAVRTIYPLSLQPNIPIPASRPLLDPDVVGSGKVLVGATGDDDIVSNSAECTGDGSGTAGRNVYTGVTDTPTTDPGWATSSTVDMNAPDGYVKAYVGTQAVVIPYWNT